MDIFSFLFRAVGAFIGSVLVLTAIWVLMHAENGVLTVESIEYAQNDLATLYDAMSLLVWPWLALGAFLLFRWFRGR